MIIYQITEVERLKKIHGVDTVELRARLMDFLECFMDEQIALGVSSEDAVNAVREAIDDIRHEWE